MPPAQKPTGAEGAARALPREQPVTAAAVTPTPVNNESAGAEGAEFIAQDLSQDPPGNDDLLSWQARLYRGGTLEHASLGSARNTPCAQPGFSEPCRVFAVCSATEVAV